MYRLELEKVEKNINPYFLIKINIGNNIYSEDRIYSNSINELREVLIEIKNSFDSIKREVIKEESNKYYSNTFNDHKIEKSLQVLKNQFISYIIFIKSSKKTRIVDKTLSDIELEAFINDLIEEEKESYDSYFEEEHYTCNEYYYNDDYIKREYIELNNRKKYLRELHKKSINKEEIDLLEEEIESYYKRFNQLKKSKIKKIKKILKNKEKYRVQERSETYYEYSVGNISFEVKYFDEKEIEYDVQIKEVKELIEDF